MSKLHGCVTESLFRYYNLLFFTRCILRHVPIYVLHYNLASAVASAFFKTALLLFLVSVNIYLIQYVAFP